MGLFKRLKDGLSKTRSSLSGGISKVFQSHEKITDDFSDDLEETMIMGDMGAVTTENIIDELKEKVYDRGLKTTNQCRNLLIEGIARQMQTTKADYAFENQRSVILLVGVNGVGKTTTAGKLASIYHKQGKKVMLAAADTFRAAATEQLEIWAERANVPLISAHEGADPGSVVFDAVSSAKAKGVDMLFIDTAGRLHNKKNLMAELGKIYRILEREYPDALLETLLVLDGTTGQNAISQAHEFAEIAKVTGLVITKLDGTARGGIAIALSSELGVPVKFIGVGEKLEDLQKFDPQAFCKALFAESDRDDDEDEDEESWG